MIWHFYRSSAPQATLLSFHLLRPMPRSLMVAGSLPHVRAVLATFPRRKRPYGRLATPGQRDLARAQGTHRGSGVQGSGSHLGESQADDPGMGKTVARSPSRALPRCGGSGVQRVSFRRRGSVDKGTEECTARSVPWVAPMAPGSSQAVPWGGRLWQEG